MIKKTPQLRVLLRCCRQQVRFVVLGVFLFATAAASVMTLLEPVTTTAATNNALNFQARLQTASGAIVPDGDYNIQFKLYDDPDPGEGTLLWTESWYDSNGVTAGNDNRLEVKNGYFSANLGSLTAFSSSINWDQQLWLTMNVGGAAQTGSPSYDGEMEPRLKLTGVPYAFRAGELAAYNSGSGYSGLLQFQATTGGNQTFVIPDQGAGGTYSLLTSGAADAGYIQNGASSQTANFNISGNGYLAGNLGVGTTSAAEKLTVDGNFMVRNADSASRAARLNTGSGTLGLEGAGAQFTISNWSNADFTGTQRKYLVLESGSNVAQVLGSWQFKTAADGTTRHTVDGTTGTDVKFNQDGEATDFSVQGDTDANLLYLKGSTDRVGIGTNTPGYKLDVAGDINTSGVYRVGGTSGATTTCSGGQFLQNAVVAGGITTGGTCATPTDTGVTTVGTINGQTKSANGAVISGTSIYMQTADASNPGMVSTGSQTFAGNKSFNSDGTGAFIVQNAAGNNNAFIVDTSNARVAIGKTLPAYALDVVGDVNASLTLKIAGTTVCDSAGCTAKTGSGFYIHNQTTVQSANMFIQASDTTKPTAVFEQAASGSADIFQVLKNDGTTKFLSLDSAGSFAVANAATYSLASTTSGSVTSSGGITITGGASSTYTTTTGSLTLQAGGTNNLNLQTGGAGIINMGVSNTTAINIGNTSGASSLNLQAGTGNINAMASNLLTPNGGFGRYQNLLTYSEQFDNAAWTKTNVTAPTADTIVAPDGQSTTAESLSDSSSGGSVSQSTATVKTNNTYTFSVWLKTTSGNTQTVDLRIDGTGSGTGTKTTVTATSSWQRFSVSQNPNAFTGNLKVMIFPGGTGASNANAVHAWGAQLELAGSPGVYSQTVASTFASTGTGLVATGQSVFRNSVDSTTAFQVQNAAGNSYILVDTSTPKLSLGDTGIAGTVQIGNTTGAVAQTINVGNNNTASSTTTVVMGSVIGASATTIQGGTGNVNITSSGSILFDKVSGNPLLTTASGTASTKGLTLSTGAVTGGSAQTTGTLTLSTGDGSGTNTSSGAVSIDSGAKTGSGTSGAITIGGANAPTVNIANNNAAHTINIANGGSSTAQAVNIGSTGSTSNVAIQGGNGSSAITLQTASGGTIGIGNAGVAGTVQIGNTTSTTAQTINIGNNATATSTTTVNIGSTSDGSATIIQGGTGDITLQSADSIIAKVTTDSGRAFEIQKSSGDAILTVDTSHGYVLTNNVAQGDNLLDNPSFESSATNSSGSGWYFPNNYTIANDSNAHTGNQELKVTANSNTTDAAAGKRVEVTPGDTYYMEGWVKTAGGTNGSGGFYTQQTDKDDANATFAALGGSYIAAPGTTYTRISGTVTIASGKKYLSIAATVRNDSTTGTWYFDDVVLRKVNTTGPVTVQSTVNAASAFQVQNASGANLFNVDTSTGTVNINQSKVNILGIAHPTNVQLSSSGAGGSLAAGTYYYGITAVAPSGETDIVYSSPTSATTTGSTSRNTLSWDDVAGETSYKVYRSTDNGATWYVNTIAAGTTSIIDNGSTYTWSTNAGSILPLASNSTANLIMQTGTWLFMDGGAGNGLAGFNYVNPNNYLTMANYNSGGGLVLDGDYLNVRDTTGYHTNMSLTNTGAATFSNRTNSAAGFQIQNATGSQAFVVDTTATNSNLISNPDFETDASGTAGKGVATAARSTAQKQYGNASLLVTVPNAFSGQGAYVTGFTQTVAAGTYTFSFDLRLAAGTWAGTQIIAGYTTTSDTNACTFTTTAEDALTTGFRHYTCTFTAGATVTKVYVAQNDAVIRNFYLDGLRLEAGSTAAPYQAAAVSTAGSALKTTGNLFVDYNQSNNCTGNFNTCGGIKFGSDTSGEGISSNRSVSSASNYNGLDFYTNNVKRFSLTNGGNAVFQNSSAVALFTVDASASRLYVGPTAGDTTGATLVLGTKTNSGDPSGVNGAMYYNEAMQQYRCYSSVSGTEADGEWSACGVNPIDRGFFIEDEFTSGSTTATTGATGIGNQNWTLIKAFGSSTCTIGYNSTTTFTPTGDHPGTLSINAGAASNSGCKLGLTSQGTGTESMVLTTGTVAKTSVAVTTTATNLVYRVGLTNINNASGGDTGNPTTGAWFEAVPIVSTNWRYCYVNAGPSTVCASTGIPIAANTFIPLEIRVTGLGSGTSSLEFLANGTKFTVSGSITVNTTNGVSPSMQCFTSTATPLSCGMDYWQSRSYSSAQR